MRVVSLLVPLMLATLGLQAQSTLQIADPPHRDWHASWITHPIAPLRDPLVLHFRKTIGLAVAPAAYMVRVSADNRFILYVNGHRVGDGPARGDLSHWRYVRFDLAPFLQAGQNVIAVTVWNWGILAPLAQISDRTAFLLESDATGDAGISTPEGWRVEEESGHRALDRASVTQRAYMAAGPGEEVDAARYDWEWNSAMDEKGSWVAAASPMRDSIYAGASKARSADAAGDNPWGLVPDALPAMEYTDTSAGEAVRSELDSLRAFPAAAVLVPAGEHVHLLLDRKTLTTAYPQLTVSGGKGARIWLTYAEALYDKDGLKGDRDEVGSRIPQGLRDSFVPDGGEHRTFEPLWWRTWRYLELDIQTGDEPLKLESLRAEFTAYPFEERATFKSADPDLDRIWEISWRTVRLDAHETYMDTPYYEQLQYVGDTRIQALISYAVTGDDRLARQALLAFDASRKPDGLTTSRYPSSLEQRIPTFSLLYVGMVHDYWMYRPDAATVQELLPGTRSVLDWFAQYEQPDGLLRELPWWSFIDWAGTGKIPTYDAHGESCVTTLEYLGALNDAASLEKGIGDPDRAARYLLRASYVRSSLQSKCWNAKRGLVADTAEQTSFSQQANIPGVLYDVVPKEKQKQVLTEMLLVDPGTTGPGTTGPGTAGSGPTPDGVLSASYYFRFYLARALEHAGMADEYLRSIDPWRKLVALHFSTWPEVPGNTRSDSHAWTAHPIYDLLTLVAGIEPGSPGFATVRIAPNLAYLPSLKATYPHPQGMIQVEYERKDRGLAATIILPGKLTGTFVFHGKSWALKPGTNTIQTP